MSCLSSSQSDDCTTCTTVLSQFKRHIHNVTHPQYKLTEFLEKLVAEVNRVQLCGLNDVEKEELKEQGDTEDWPWQPQKTTLEDLANIEIANSLMKEEEEEEGVTSTLEDNSAIKEEGLSTPVSEDGKPPVKKKRPKRFIPLDKDVPKVRKHSCSYCGKGFIRYSDCDLHIKGVHLKQFDKQCSACGKKFLTNQTLKIHYRGVHLNERPFKCTQCDLAFHLKTGLAKHVKTVHLLIRDYICDLCGKDYTDGSSLKKHVRNVHEKQETSDIVPLE